MLESVRVIRREPFSIPCESDEQISAAADEMKRMSRIVVGAGRDQLKIDLEALIRSQLSKHRSPDFPELPGRRLRDRRFRGRAGERYRGPAGRLTPAHETLTLLAT